MANTLYPAYLEIKTNDDKAVFECGHGSKGKNGDSTLIEKMCPVTMFDTAAARMGGGGRQTGLLAPTINVSVDFSEAIPLILNKVRDNRLKVKVYLWSEATGAQAVSEKKENAIPRNWCLCELTDAVVHHMNLSHSEGGSMQVNISFYGTKAEWTYFKPDSGKVSGIFDTTTADISVA